MIRSPGLTTTFVAPSDRIIQSDSSPSAEVSITTSFVPINTVPGAAVILYGSRARGDARTDSDYDLLVLVDGEVDWKLEDQIRQCLYPLELATGAVLTVYAYSHRTWDSPLYRAMPFTQHVERDGVVL